MGRIMGKDILPDVKLRKPRAKETQPRKAYDRAEDRLRPLIRTELRRLGYVVRRVEPAVSGEFGLGDFWVMNERKKWAGWIEVKTEKGRLEDEQKEIQRLCLVCGVNYRVVRSVEECQILY